MSGVALVVLTSLPISGTVCALLCNAAGRNAANGSGHHGSAMNCEEPAGPFTAAQISGVPERDCGNHPVNLQQTPVTAAGKTDWVSAAGSRATPTLWVATTALAESAPRAERGAPPCISPPTIPPVLRV